MKGNSLLKSVAVLGLLLGVYFLVKYTSDGGRSKSFREVLVEIDTAKVTKVEITSGDMTTTLQKDAGAWTVGEGKVALGSSVLSLLNSLNQVEPSRLASRSEDSWADFQVDTTGTQVKVYEGSTKSLDLVIGRFGVEGQRSYYTYVRLSEDTDVYVANNFMGMSVGKSDIDYRNNQIMRLKKDSISSIDFNYPEGTYALEKSIDGDWLMAGVPADSANVAGFLSGLTFVSSKNFLDDPIGESDKQVVIHLNGSEDVTLSSYGENILGSSYNQAEFFEDNTAYDKIFKSAEYFAGTPE